MDCCMCGERIEPTDVDVSIDGKRAHLLATVCIRRVRASRDAALARATAAEGLVDKLAAVIEAAFSEDFGKLAGRVTYDEVPGLLERARALRGKEPG